MQFLELYTTALDTELGSIQTTLFTTVRRKRAINLGQTEFLRLTNCYVRRYSLTLVDDTAEYDLIASIGEANFFRLSSQLPVIKRTISSTVTHLGGQDLPRRSPDWLDEHRPGWRDADEGTPTAWYIREEEGTTLFGLNPPPKIAVGDTWLGLIPYVAIPDTLSGDTDEPFSTGTPTQTDLRPYHQALAHFGAGKMELLRRNYPASDRQMQLFAGYVADFLENRKVEGPQHVVLARSYLGDANRFGRHYESGDPRR